MASGSFEANRRTISSEVSGRILRWAIDEGVHVKQGEVVGQVDTIQLYLQRMALQVGKKGVKASEPDMATQTAALQEQLEKLNTERERTQKLVEANALSRKQLEDIEAQIRVLTRELAAARSKISQSVQQIDAKSSSMDIQVAQIDDMLSKSAIKSPIEGVVVQNFIQEGELAVAGHPLFQVADLSRLSLRAFLPFYMLSHLRLGDTVKVFADQGRGAQREYRGVVSWIAEQAEFTPKNIQTQDERENLVYAVKVSVKNDGDLKIGMYGELHFPPRQK